MCGIAGMVRFDGAPVSPEQVWPSVHLIEHRGPDHQAVWTDLGVGLGHARLSILDVSDDAHQPMHSACGRYVMVYNGEVYNFAALRQQFLSGHHFRSASDSEVLLELYAQQGEDCVKELRGMFAFAIWDRQEKSLFLARDRVGQKPLYFREENGCLYFASEVRALRGFDDLTWDVDQEAVWHYLTYQYIPSPMTIYRGVEKLPPATVMHWRQGQTARRRYWQ